MWSTQTCYPDLASELIQGKSLHIFLRPDKAVKARKGHQTYIETLKLNHAVVYGDAVWGMQEHHAIHQDDNGMIKAINSYAYSNAMDLFISITAGEKLAQQQANQLVCTILSTGRYAELQWIIRDDFELIWDTATGTGDHGLSVFEEKIRQGCEFKIGLLDSAGVWNFHPVHYPFVFPEDGYFTLQTHIDFYPAFFREDPTGLKAFIEKNEPEMLDSTDLTGREKNISVQSPSYCTYFEVKSDGSYQNFFDKVLKKEQQYQRLKLFSRKL